VPSDLTGVALVTGGGRGIGATIARGLAEQGMQVAVSGRTRERVESVASEMGGLALVGDVTERVDVEAWVARTEAELGPIDLLVSNAGISGSDRLAWEQDPDEWWRTVEVDLLGPYLCARAVIPGMLTRRSGRIVNVASNAAFLRFEPGSPRFSAYGAAKAGLVRLTEALSHELRESGVSVFAISPGMVETDMTREVFAGAPSDAWTPPERTADLIAFMATGALDALSGRYVHARNDDWRALPGRADEILADDLLALRLRREGL
jgi:3-oxoacyl-[acyl-carrier protein] reductase